MTKATAAMEGITIDALTKVLFTYDQIDRILGVLETAKDESSSPPEVDALNEIMDVIHTAEMLARRSSVKILTRETIR